MKEYTYENTHTSERFTIITETPETEVWIEAVEVCERRGWSYDHDVRLYSVKVVGRGPMAPIHGKKEAVKAAYRALEEAIKDYEAEVAYLNLNNLYLDIQAGRVKLTRKEYNRLDSLLGQVYSHTDPMHDWWWREFQKLPNWLNV